MYKIAGCPAINEFKPSDYFLNHTYGPKEYFPALLKQGDKKAARIYKKVVDFDDAGIPMLKQFTQAYWPVTIAQYGLLHYNFYLTYKRESDRECVIRICNWLVDNIAESGAWEHNITYHCNVTNEDLFPPYPSAMVQGEAISLLVRGYELTKNADYLKCAEKALVPFRLFTTEGGVLVDIHGDYFYEEYPTPTHSLVLNGFLFSLFGLYDLSMTDSEYAKEAKMLFDKGARTLVKLLPMYDGGFCSRYSLSHVSAAPNNDNKNPFYHGIHVNQLIAINSILHSSIIDYYINEWK